jgi:Na+-driven multidrug efflux pump
MASIVANIVNFGLDFFLIFGPPKMGVAGAAIATSVRPSHGLLLRGAREQGR